jgi:hypothetical protein
MLVACGTEDTPEVWVWNAISGDLHVKISPWARRTRFHTSWHQMSRKFVVGGTTWPVLSMCE